MSEASAYKPVLLCFFPKHSTFIDKDLEILSIDFELKGHQFRKSPKAILFFRFVSQFFFLLKNIFQAKMIVCEFSGRHAYLPGLFGKWRNVPVLIISAGTDCASFPSIHYGNYTKRWVGMFTRRSFRLCSHISPVHETLIHRTDTYSPETPPEQGIYHHVPGLDTPYTMIPYGFDSTKWVPSSEPRKPHSFITVAYILGKITFTLKGIDLIFQVAPLFPECTFTVVGNKYHYPGTVPTNVQLIGPTPNQEILSLYQSHEFYLQMSISEGHPNAICEAMLCGCIPIGSDVTAIPDIIGESGYIVPRKSVDLFASTIQEAITGSKEEKAQLSRLARKRIQEEYPLERRTSEMRTLVKRLAGISR